MDSSDLLTLIKQTDDVIKMYSLQFHAVVKPIEAIFSIGTHNRQEFTNAHIATDYIKTYFKSKDCYNFFVRELPIKYSISESSLNIVEGEAKGYKAYKKSFKDKSVVSVDAYFDINIDVESKDSGIDGQQIRYLFIEYKVSKLFKYLSLAEDYLKYKIYTYYNEDKTAFVFITFDNKDIYPTVLKAGSPQYVLLSKIISKSMFSKDDRIFIYIPRKTINSNNGDISFEPVLTKSYKVLNKISHITDKMSEEDIENKLHNKLRDNFYCSNINSFKNNVLTAHILVSNYQNFIFPLFNELFTKGIIDDKEISQDTLNKMKKEFKELERTFFSDGKNKSLRDGLSTGYKSSFYILLLFNAIAKANHLDFSPKLHTLNVDTKNGQENINYKAILEEKTKLIMESNNGRNLSFLSYNLLIFVVKLYKTIFEFNEDGEYRFNKEYELFKSATRLQTLINELRKIVGFKESVNVFGNDLEEGTMELCNYIVKLIEGVDLSQ